MWLWKTNYTRNIWNVFIFSPPLHSKRDQISPVIKFLQHLFISFMHFITPKMLNSWLWSIRLGVDSFSINAAMTIVLAKSQITGYLTIPLFEYVIVSIATIYTGTCSIQDRELCGFWVKWQAAFVLPSRERKKWGWWRNDSNNKCNVIEVMVMFLITGTVS